EDNVLDRAPNSFPTRRSSDLGAFKVKDGYVVMTLMGDLMWKRFCAMIGKPDLETHPDLNPDSARGARYESVLRPLLEEWARDKTDRKSTRLNSSHVKISYAVF